MVSFSEVYGDLGVRRVLLVLRELTWLLVVVKMKDEK